jgi:SAM-dependent methyltransferase
VGGQDHRTLPEGPEGAVRDEPGFDAQGLFDEDYLHFYAGALGDERSDAETELLCRLLELQPGMEVLDLACGHGRIVNRLAARGCRVTGLDATPLLLDRARRDATDRGIAVEYVQGDMRTLPWTGRFDRVVSWFTTFGYRFPFFVRLFGFTELRDWLLGAGFTAVDGYDRDGAPLSAASRRLLVVAQR